MSARTGWTCCHERQHTNPEAHFDAHGTVEHFVPFDRRNLLVSAWRKRQLPPRDYLLEGVLSTTARWLISGDTGIGKTLFALELALRDCGGRELPELEGRPTSAR